MCKCYISKNTIVFFGPAVHLWPVIDCSHSTKPSVLQLSVSFKRENTFNKANHWVTAMFTAPASHSKLFGVTQKAIPHFTLHYSQEEPLYTINIWDSVSLPAMKQSWELSVSPPALAVHSRNSCTAPDDRGRNHGKECFLIMRLMKYKIVSQHLCNPANPETEANRNNMV